jgi:protein gp37
MHPERLGQPAATKKPGIVLCNFVNDWLDTKRSFFDSETIVGCMVPPHIYVTLTKQAIRLSHLVGEMPCLRDDFSGLTIRNQADADAKLTTFLGIQGNLWLSLEPLWGPVDFGDTWWETSDACGHGNVRGIIIGHDNRRGAPGTDTLNHVRSVVKQCQAAGIPVYVKQLWLPRGKAKGGLSKDVKDFPSDLQLRNLPWSSPK